MGYRTWPFTTILELFCVQIVGNCRNPLGSYTKNLITKTNNDKTVRNKINWRKKSVKQMRPQPSNELHDSIKNFLLDSLTPKTLEKSPNNIEIRPNLTYSVQIRFLDLKRFILRKPHSHPSECWRDSSPSKEHCKNYTNLVTN